MSKLPFLLLVDQEFQVVVVNVVKMTCLVVVVSGGNDGFGG